MDTYRPRELSAQVGRALDSMPVVVLTGMRQVGKTTFLWNQPGLAPKRRLSLDDLATLEAARQDPEGLTAGEQPVIIDEVQRVPELLLAVKSQIHGMRRPGRFLLSGSANLLLMSRVTESLAGRAIYLTMGPMTRRELRSESGTPFVIRMLESGRPPSVVGVERLRPDEVLAGGMPPVAVDRTDPEVWFTGFEQTYLERDVRELSQVADLLQFRRFLRFLAMRTGKILNVAEVARDAGLSSATGQRYVDLVETSFAGFRLPPFLASRVSRLVKRPKFFLSDSGLANHLIGERGGAMGPSDPFAGALLETYVAQNLQAILSAWLPRASLCYWCVQGRQEVDFVLEHAGRTLAIEVKSSSRWSAGDLLGLRRFVESTPGCVAGLLACNTASALPLGDKLFAVPLTVLLG
jgi:predicted AAA+ superfamily ATPase